MVTVSRWDLLHVLWSCENPPTSDRDRRERDGCVQRLLAALAEQPSPPRVLAVDG